LRKPVLWGLATFAVFFLFYSVASATDFSIHGYYRSRIEAYHDLDTQKPGGVNQGGLGDNDRFGSMLFSQQRFRIEPAIKLNDNISIHSQVDVLDNILYGTESTEQLDFLSPIVGTIQIPGAGGSLGTNGPTSVGKFNGLNVRRVYADLLTPMGKIRIGRQPSHWGLGIFQNDGNGAEGDFGDTADRILHLASLELAEGHVVSFGSSVDFAFTENKDPRDEGLGASFSGPERNMWQFAGFGLYDHKKFSIGGFVGVRYRNGIEGNTTTTAKPVLVDSTGTPVVDGDTNNQLGELTAAGADGNTLLYFADLYGKVNLSDEITIEGEYIFMNGKLSTGVAIDAIPFNGLPANALGTIDLPAQNSLRVQMAAVEARGDHSFGKWIMQGGYASGDARPLSSRVTQFGFRPDYQIAMLLFRVPLGSSPRVMQANGSGSGNRVLVGAVPVTGNFINNAIYGTLGYQQKINMKKIGSFFGPTYIGVKGITAWAPSNNFDIDFAEMTGFDDLPTVRNTRKWYGVEVDASFETTLYDYFDLTLRGAYLFAGPAYNAEADQTVFNVTNLANVVAIQSDPANDAWGVELSLRYRF
jgi:hypothetical protein